MLSSAGSMEKCPGCQAARISNTVAPVAGEVMLHEPGLFLWPGKVRGRMIVRAGRGAGEMPYARSACGRRETVWEGEQEGGGKCLDVLKNQQAARPALLSLFPHQAQCCCWNCCSCRVSPGVLRELCSVSPAALPPRPRE